MSYPYSVVDYSAPGGPRAFAPDQDALYAADIERGDQVEYVEGKMRDRTVAIISDEKLRKKAVAYSATAIACLGMGSVLFGMGVAIGSSAGLIAPLFFIITAGSCGAVGLGALPFAIYYNRQLKKEELNQ